ncbi:hypothetical protein HQN88_01140 [Paenibacillus qinlingensis]|nr:hypothetical protein [Paenibacillus qinlingensis]
MHIRKTYDDKLKWYKPFGSKMIRTRSRFPPLYTQRVPILGCMEEPTHGGGGHINGKSTVKFELFIEK